MSGTSINDCLGTEAARFNFLTFCLDNETSL